MKKFVLLLIIACFFKANAQDFTTVFEKSDGFETATYEQTIAFYKLLAATYPEISIQEMGITDSGEPLHLVIFNSDKSFDFTTLPQSKKNKVLINNGIHPGEPDGVDASMLLLRDIVQNESLKKELKNVIICIIPIYNIGGSLNRNSTSRVNQNGPVSYGFRGNARNFDLNRDFIKNDTKNAQAFSKIFQLVNPDIFIDTHVSNGADYQYVLTHLFTQHNKLGGDLGPYLETKMKPEIEKDLATKDWIITPYVNVFNNVPEKGFSQFFDSPRYSTGYSTLFNSLGFMVETHMLKPYKIRVEGTYELLLTAIHFLQKNGNEITGLRNQAIANMVSKKTYPIAWEIDSTKTTTINFKGYEGTFKQSEVTKLQRLQYDRSKPFTKSVTYYNNFKPKKEISIPNSYIIPKGWWNIIELLKNNNIDMYPIKNDTIITVESYKISSYKSYKEPFEGHFMHYDTSVNAFAEKKQFRKGDYIIPTNQNGLRYLIETLEPEAKDSFFNWNFFDIELETKEGFSPYVFEELAFEILQENPELKASFEKRQQEDTAFAKNWYAQLYYIYENSEYFEKVGLKYPIHRIVN